MPDPGSSLRAMILSQTDFDIREVRALCRLLTGGMVGRLEAQSLEEEVVREVSLLQVMLGLTAVGFTYAGDPRQAALDAVARMERNAGADDRRA